MEKRGFDTTGLLASLVGGFGAEQLARRGLAGKALHPVMENLLAGGAFGVGASLIGQGVDISRGHRQGFSLKDMATQTAMMGGLGAVMPGLRDRVKPWTARSPGVSVK